MTQSQKNKPDIIILGLGPGNPDLLTLKASRVLSNAKEIYLRTRDHPTIDGLPEDLILHSFDEMYQEEGSYPRCLSKDQR